VQVNREDGSLAIPEPARIKRRWLFGLPITILCVVSTCVSGMYAWNVAGPYESRFSYHTSVRSFIASVLLVVSMTTTWRLIRNKTGPVRVSWASRAGLLIGMLPASYYLWYTRVDARYPIDFTVGVVSICTILGQLLLSKLAWHSSTDQGRPLTG